MTAERADEGDKRRAEEARRNDGAIVTLIVQVSKDNRWDRRRAVEGREKVMRWQRVSRKRLWNWKKKVRVGVSCSRALPPSAARAKLGMPTDYVNYGCISGSR